MPQLSSEEKIAIIELRKVGLSQREIAAQLQFDRHTIDRFLKKVATKVWKAITSNYLEKLYKSMPQRMAPVIAAGGGHT